MQGLGTLRMSKPSQEKRISETSLTLALEPPVFSNPAVLYNGDFLPVCPSVQSRAGPAMRGMKGRRKNRKASASSAAEVEGLELAERKAALGNLLLIGCAQCAQLAGQVLKRRTPCSKLGASQASQLSKTISRGVFTFLFA